MRVTTEQLSSMLDSQRQEIDANSLYIEELVNEIVTSCCADLDNYVGYVKGALDDIDNPITDKELDDIVMSLPTLLYFTSEQQESLGIKADVAKMIENDKYNNALLECEGTALTKQANAKLHTQNEALMSSVYQRVEKKIKLKTECAMELLQSCKKVLSRRMSELEITRSTPNKSKS